MFNIHQDTLMGVGIVLASLMLLVRERWFLAHSQKGQNLVKRFGPDQALWVLRAILVGVIVFGGLLAGGIIRPIQWGSS